MYDAEKLELESKGGVSFELDPNETLSIGGETPLMKGDDFFEKTGIYADVIASVRAGDKDFLVVNLDGSNKPYLLIDETFSPEYHIGYKGLEPGKPITIGRRHLNDRFEYSGYVSRDHFDIWCTDDGTIYVRNQQPLNETVVHAVEIRSESTRGRTIQVQRRLGHNPGFSGEMSDIAPYGYFKGYPILGRNSSYINGGVYLGGGSREAIVVDGESPEMRELSKTFLHELMVESRDRIVTERWILQRVMDKVQRMMPVDDSVASTMHRRYNNDEIVGLSKYLRNGGVCRHQALLSAFLIEKLSDNSLISGRVGVERNTSIDRYSHAWAVLKHDTNQDNTIVIDATQNFLGTKNQAHRLQSQGVWNYYL